MSMLEQHEVAAYLLARRLVRRRSIVSGSLRISDASSRNRNFRVSGGAGESLLRKQGVAADSAASLDALHHRRGRPSATLAAALGRALAAVHAVARDEQALREDAPWVLSLHRPPLEALRYLSAASVELLGLLQAEAGETEHALLAPRADFTLCHGLAGHADVCCSARACCRRRRRSPGASPRSASGATRRASTAGPAAPDVPRRC